MANVTFEGIPIPNPLAIQALLPAQISHELDTAGLIYAGCTGVLVWDILSNASVDLKLLLAQKISLPAFVYWFSRFATLGFILGAVIYRTVPLGNCLASARIVNSFIPLAASSTACLFFLRIKAIFNTNPIVVSGFFLLWLGVVGSMVTIPIAFQGGRVPPTQWCMFTHIERHVVVAAIFPLIHDTSVFVAISWRLLQNTYIDLEFNASLMTFFSGKNMPAFSRALLQDGQKYYLFVVISNLLVAIMVFMPNVSNAYRIMFMVPNLTIMNIMACLVYRKTKQGFILEESISSSILFTSRPTQQDFSLATFSRSDGQEDSTRERGIDLV